jgi:hypothetical protein
LRGAGGPLSLEGAMTIKLKSIVLWFEGVPLRNGREEALHFFQKVRNRPTVAREMPQQASLEESIKQRIESTARDRRLSAAE